VGARPAACACVVLVALAGCGSGDRGRDAAAVAEGFHAALESGDGQAACQALSEESASKLEQQEQKPCEEAILSLELPKGATVADTRVYMKSAIANLADSGVDFLDEATDGWRISAAGCEPTAPDRPYDCELED
jgi:hypothetical protein